MILFPSELLINSSDKSTEGLLVQAVSNVKSHWSDPSKLSERGILGGGGGEDPSCPSKL
ncbi:hypothetical protein F7725_024917 [Dissostichus mawsoni]|uniref:Uncharacterized protein n=1 Tax=Dissostichus mawsoni TaxID=36200 RepID=A0A7J5XA60_DISMA|nr:hypothetical protein F7725_024917 [Dissostichus mawsoni]